MPLHNENGPTIEEVPLQGRNQSEQNADSWWWSCGIQAVRALAAVGRPFTIDDVRDLGIPEPDEACRYGSLIAACRRRGLIELAGTALGRNGRPTMVWRGVGDDR